jgi:ATP-dependent Clp protease ATP-binding subunit ClpA
VIDEAGAAQKILPKSKQKKTINKTEIEEMSRDRAIPPKSVTPTNVLRTLDRDLKTSYVGQDKATDALASAIKMGLGLGNPLKPIGNFLFSGLTGVGKTEVAWQFRVLPRRRADPLRHVRIHGTACGIAADGTPPVMSDSTRAAS